MKITTPTFLCQKLPIICRYILFEDYNNNFSLSKVTNHRYILFEDWNNNFFLSKVSNHRNEVYSICRTLWMKDEYQKLFFVKSYQSYIGIFDLTHTHLVTLKLEELWKIVKKRKCSDDTWSVVSFKKKLEEFAQKNCTNIFEKKLYKKRCIKKSCTAKSCKKNCDKKVVRTNYAPRWQVRSWDSERIGHLDWIKATEKTRRKGSTMWKITMKKRRKI